MSESEGSVVESDAPAGSVLAAPEDGRTPPKPSPAVTNPFSSSAVPLPLFIMLVNNH
jgi:hypothetical protein